MNDATEFRSVTYRLHPGTRARHRKLLQTAGACRYVWNHFLACNRRDYATYKLRKAIFDAGLVFDKPSPPSVSFQSMGVRFTALRRETPWLQRLPYAPVRYVLKYQAEAWKRAFAGDLFRMPDMARLQARKRRYQRMVARRRKGSNRRNRARHRLARTQRRIATIRHRWHHETSRIFAGTAGLLAVEDLKTKAMTRSARGSAEHPGSNVRQKAGLNREILNTGWSQLRRMLEYKAAHVEVVPPMYTSQTCRRCGRVDPASRKSQSKFECVHCGHKGNAVVNAALNIMASATGATGRRGALALATPKNRQQVYRRRAA